MALLVVPPPPSARSILEVELRWPTRAMPATLLAADPLGFLFARLPAWAIDGRLVVDLLRSKAAADVGGVGLDEVLGIYGESLSLLGRVVDPMTEPVPEALPGQMPVVSADEAGWRPLTPALVKAMAAQLHGLSPTVGAEQRALRWLADSDAPPWPDPGDRLREAVEEFSGQGLHLPPGRMDTHVALVHELAGQLAGTGTDMESLWGEDIWEGDEWMWNLGSVLAGAGRVDDAVAVSDAMASFHHPFRDEHLANAALVLARSGRGAEARPRLEALFAKAPDDRLVATLSAEAYEAMEDDPAAESAFRRAVDLSVARGEHGEVEDALDRLASFHESVGQAEEARAARERLRSWRRGTGTLTSSVRAASTTSAPTSQ